MQGNIGDLGLGKSFLDMTPKAQTNHRGKKLDLIKIKNFCLSKDTIKIVTGNLHNGRKYLKIKCMISLVYRTYKN